MAFRVMQGLDPLGSHALDAAASAEENAVLSRITAAAADHERRGVPRLVMDQLSAIGWLGPVAPAPQQRERAERLAMADTAVWFCWSQHQSALRLLKASTNETLKARWLDRLASGTAVGATAFAHLRRPGPANPVASPCGDNWTLQGQLDWVTSWDLADVVALQVRTGQEPQAPVLALLIDKQAQASLPRGLTPEPPLQLMAMGGTWSRPVRLNHCPIQKSWVMGTTPIATWTRADQARTRSANPAAFGLIRAALGDLLQQALHRQAAGWNTSAQILLKEASDLRRRCYSAADHPDSLSDTAHHDLRAAALEMAERCCRAALVSHGGGALRGGHPSGRRLREALFLQVQALITPVQDRLIAGRDSSAQLTPDCDQL